jgi:hypothetical protein
MAYPARGVLPPQPSEDSHVLQHKPRLRKGVEEEHFYCSDQYILMERIGSILHPNLTHIQCREDFIFLGSLSEGCQNFDGSSFKIWVVLGIDELEEQLKRFGVLGEWNNFV